MAEEEPRSDAADVDEEESPENRLAKLNFEFSSFITIREPFLLLLLPCWRSWLFRGMVAMDVRELDGTKEKDWTSESDVTAMIAVAS